MRIAFFAFFALAACGWPDNSSPDGGRVRVNCDQTVLFVPVTVLDRTGALLADATVLAVNSSDSSRTETGTTNGAGIFKVTSNVGPGVVKVTATFNDLKTPEANFTVTPGECTPAVSPNNVTIQLK